MRIRPIFISGLFAAVLFGAAAPAAADQASKERVMVEIFKVMKMDQMVPWMAEAWAVPKGQEIGKRFSRNVQVRLRERGIQM